MSSCGPDADTLCIQSISFCPELRPLLDHLSAEAKGRQPLQLFPSVFLFQVPTLSKEEKQIRIKGWRKAFEVFDSYTVIIQNRAVLPKEYRAGPVLHPASRTGFVMDAIVRARDSVRNKMVSPPLFLKKLRAAGGQRDKREKDR